MSTVRYTKLKLNNSLLKALHKRFITFDTETTGLDPWCCRVIEVGAVLFEHGKPVSRYGSLVHSVDFVPYEAQMVNHITSAMLRQAPRPEKVYHDLMEFFGDALCGGTILVGHNATFDMRFLEMELRRLNQNADILYADTCSLSRTALPNLYSHTQDTVAHHFGIRNKQSHRAETDAETCGEILVKMLPILESSEKMLSETESRDTKRQKYEPDADKKAFCNAMIHNACSENVQTDHLCFQQAGKLLHVRSVMPLFSINLEGKHPYILAEKALLDTIADSSQYQNCTAGEAKLYDNAVRLPVGDDATGLAQQILIRALSQYTYKQDVILKDAVQYWEVKREMELCWKPDESE